MGTRSGRIMALATLGAGSGEEDRIKELLGPLSPEIFPYDRARKALSFMRLVSAILRSRPALLCQEGSGIGGAAALLFARAVLGTPYVVSSGDAIAPFVASRHPFLRPIFAAYERGLCRFSAGFIGWTPYLTGRALTLGARRAMTAPGWAAFSFSPAEGAQARVRIRTDLGIGQDELVIGIHGSLVWNKRLGYCYGLELVRSVKAVRRRRVHGIIIGSGDGTAHLRNEAGDALGKTIHLIERVPRNELPAYLASLDIASLPQSVDSLGSFRYTTKLSEYLAARLPVATSGIPLSYDLAGDWSWRLPGAYPSEPAYIRALTSLLERVARGEISKKSSETPKAAVYFDRDSQISRVTEFIQDILYGEGGPPPQGA